VIIGYIGARIFCLNSARGRVNISFFFNIFAYQCTSVFAGGLARVKAFISPKKSRLR